MAQNYRTNFEYRNAGTYPGGALSAGLSLVSTRARSSLSSIKAAKSYASIIKQRSTTR
jgi:hypothetical protein